MKSNKVQIHIKVTPELREKLRMIAFAKNITMQEYAEDILVKGMMERINELEAISKDMIKRMKKGYNE